MQNSTLIVVIGVLTAAVVVAISAIFIWYDGDKVLVAGTIGSIYGLAISNLAALRQSTANAEVLKVVQADVAGNTAVTETATRAIVEVQERAAETHKLVDGQAHEWRAALEKIAELNALIAGLTGAAEGREEGRKIAIDLLAVNAQTPERQSDGTLVVTAPAIIAVKAPEGEPKP